VSGTSRTCPARPKDLLPLFDAGQVPPIPPDPPTMHFFSDASLRRCQVSPPGLHFKQVFFGRAGTSGPKGPYPPSPALLWCFMSCPNPPQPSCTTYVSLFLSFLSLICTLHPDVSLFFVWVQASEPKQIGFLEVPKHQNRFKRSPNHSPTPLHRVSSLTSSPFFSPGIGLNHIIFRLFLAKV